jgi:hypothetical protein
MNEPHTHHEHTTHTHTTHRHTTHTPHAHRTHTHEPHNTHKHMQKNEKTKTGSNDTADLQRGPHGNLDWKNNKILAQWPGIIIPTI